MEKELKNLRKAMDSSTHKGKHFTDIQKEGIRSTLHYDEKKVISKSKIPVLIISSLAASLFLFLFYTDILANLSFTNSENNGVYVENNNVEDVPVFVKVADLEVVDWNRKAVNLGENILGNKNKSGVIGADMPSININQKWMWHLWGIEDPTETELTVIGFHRETRTVHPILTRGWTIDGLGGKNNGADAHSPSSVNIPSAGDWAVLLYVDGKLFDILVYNISK
jgi:hypothetical protein